MRLARTLYVFAMTMWIGAVAFFSLVVLPVLFTHLEPPNAGAIAALIFPHYYRAGTAFGAVVVAATGYLAYRIRGPWRAAAALALLMLASQGYATFFVQPRMAAIRGVESARQEFDSLHRRSVELNGLVLVGGVVLLLTSGILLDRR